jgi:sialate O-acetylesterase
MKARGAGVRVLATVSAAAVFLACVSEPVKPKRPAPLEISAMFGDGMVLQRERPLPLWGRGEAGLRVRASFAGQEKSAAVGGDGRWEIAMDPLPASSEARDFSIGYDSSDPSAKGYAVPGPILVENVLVGDVWYCAGQSNMEFGMGGIVDLGEELDDSDYPLIRLFLAAKSANGVPQPDPRGEWREAGSENLTSGGWYGFSAVAFAYGRKLIKETGVPQGLIQAAYGGSPIDAWIPPEELRSTKGLERFLAAYNQTERKWADAKAKDPAAPHPLGAISDPGRLKPATCYNALLAPIAPYAIRGALWYQGESDVGKGPVYAIEMGALIAALRRLFRDPALPFYFAQIAPWKYGGNGLSLPGLWKAQYAALSIPGTGMAVTADLGDGNDIHPRNKKPVGERLALIALRDVYGRTDVDAQGPLALRAAAKDGEAIVAFSGADEGLVTPDGMDPRGFSLAGSDGAFGPASAHIQGRSVVLKAQGGEKPAWVRYAWNDLPMDANLYDAHGLPARPFEIAVE